MKRIVLVVLMLLVFLSTLLNAFAAEYTAETDSYIYLEHGDYIRIEVSSIDTRESSRKVGNKTYIYYNSSDKELWRATLTGSFTYTGTSAVCTSSSCSVAISDANWSIVSKTAGRSDNSATASVIMERKLLGVVIDNAEVRMRLTCDNYGNLS